MPGVSVLQEELNGEKYTVFTARGITDLCNLSITTQNFLDEFEAVLRCSRMKIELGLSRIGANYLLFAAKIIQRRANTS